MKRVGIRELRQNASAVLREVASGEVVEVTDRGIAVARIVPMHESSRLDQLVAENRASLATGDLLDVKPTQRIDGKPLLSQVLADIRTDER
ncbi:MAG TPA: type II toxin-antitoxin system prevent-host-death family antitoxin [Candidatus Acidoferrum sp.]|jgi:prevent-host-death family protein|nr:type II toxin-antitoxin system prevent-host-death family antitoxin [Candidatus Acidoferrum sp.]